MLADWSRQHRVTVCVDVVPHLLKWVTYLKCIKYLEMAYCTFYVTGSTWKWCLLYIFCRLYLEKVPALYSVLQGPPGSSIYWFIINSVLWDLPGIGMCTIFHVTGYTWKWCLLYILCYRVYMEVVQTEGGFDLASRLVPVILERSSLLYDISPYKQQVQK